MPPFSQEETAGRISAVDLVEPNHAWAEVIKAEDVAPISLKAAELGGPKGHG